MILLRHICLFVLIWGGALHPAHAQTTTLPVRSGEHALFTRLVIRMPAENTWRVESHPGAARLLVEGPPLRFDISQSFAKIPRTRLRNLRASENQLELELACLCEIRASEDIPQYLVIDILGLTEATTAAASSMPRPLPRPAQLVSRTRPAELASNRAGVSLARNLRGQGAASADGISLTLHGILGDMPTMADAAPQVGTPAARAAAQPDMAAELGRIIAQSVAQGVLVPSGQAGSLSDGKDSQDLADIHRHDGDVAGHVAIRGRNAGPSGSSGGNTDPACMNLARLGLTDTDDDRASHRMLPPVALVFDDLDQFNRDAAIAFVRTLIARGLGAEARVMTTLFPPDDPVAELVAALGRIVDDGPAEQDALAGLAVCGAEGSLWAFLGRAQSRPVGTFAFDQVVQGFEALPAVLRKHLGPQLARELLALEQLDAARRVNASLERITTHPGVGDAIAATALALAEIPDHARGFMQAISLRDLSDELLLMMLSQAEAQSVPLRPEILSLGRDRLFVLRGDPVGRDLAPLVARALARDRAFAEAFALAQGRDVRLSPEDVSGLTQDLLDMLLTTAEDDVFVMQVFDQRPWEWTDLRETLGSDLANRLEALGFADQADLLRRAASRAAAGEVLPDGTENAPVDHISSGAEAAEDLAGSQDLRLAEADQASGPSVPENGGIFPASEVSAADAILTEMDARRGREVDGLVENGADEAMFETRNVPRVAPMTTAPAAAEAIPDVEADVTVLGQDQEPLETGGVLAETRSLLDASAALREQLQALLLE